MKIKIPIEIGTIEIHTDTNHGSIDAVIINGKDLANHTFAEAIIELIGIGKWSELVARESETNGFQKWLDEYAVPV